MVEEVNTAEKLVNPPMDEMKARDHEELTQVDLSNRMLIRLKEKAELDDLLNTFENAMGLLAVWEAQVYAYNNQLLAIEGTFELEQGHTFYEVEPWVRVNSLLQEAEEKQILQKRAVQVIATRLSMLKQGRFQFNLVVL